MTANELLVLLGGAAAIAWVNWYFLLAGRRSITSASSRGGVQEIIVIVDGGYEPGNIRLQAGRPARLVFDRRDSSSCSDEVVLPEFGIRAFLPSFQRTSVEFTPERPGEYEFTCGMSMHRGRLLVER